MHHGQNNINHIYENINRSFRFFRKNLLPKLLSQGFDIIVLSRNISEFHYLSKYKIKYLIYSDENGFKTHEIKPDLIIHLATYFVSKHKSSDIKISRFKYTRSLLIRIFKT